MNETKKDDVRAHVRQSYANVAKASNSGCGTSDASSCCGVASQDDIEQLFSTRLGYSQTDVEAVPQGADMGLGCGNPKAIAALQCGETVLDLGSGGGFDCFLAASEVGSTGHVIGVDMTPEMLSKARKNAESSQFNHVEFRLGEIEYLPVADQSIDVIISNCVVNLSPNKQQVFNEAFRVLKEGGRLAISDVVATAEMPENMKNDPKLYAGCMAGASMIIDLEKMMHNAGFSKINITPKDESKSFIRDWAPGRGVEDYVLSAHIEAVK